MAEKRLIFIRHALPVRHEAQEAASQRTAPEIGLIICSAEQEISKRTNLKEEVL
jgi:hypothetical protein